MRSPCFCQLPFRSETNVLYKQQLFALHTLVRALIINYFLIICSISALIGYDNYLLNPISILDHLNPLFNYLPSEVSSSLCVTAPALLKSDLPAMAAHAKPIQPSGVREQSAALTHAGAMADVFLAAIALDETNINLVDTLRFSHAWGRDEQSAHQLQPGKHGARSAPKHWLDYVGRETRREIREV